MIKIKKAFTMVEIIFVILIVGILSATVIPRLNMMRDDAKISLCVQEATQFLSELSIYYTSKSVFTNVSKMTNFETNLTSDANGFTSDIDMTIPSTVGNGAMATYKCNGLNSVQFQASIDINGTVWITTGDGATNSIGIGKNVSKILASKGFYKSYQIGGVHITYGFQNN